MSSNINTIIGKEPFTRDKLDSWTNMSPAAALDHAEQNKHLRFMMASSIIKNILLSHTARIGRKPQEIKVLDVGCGWGKVAIPLHDAGFQVTAIDISPAMIQLLQKKKGARNIQAQVCDITTVDPQQLGKFDYIIMSQILGHYKNSWEEFLNATSRYLASGGCLVFEMRNFEFLHTLANIYGQHPDNFYRQYYGLVSHGSDGSHLHHGLHSHEMADFAARNGFTIAERRQIHPLLSHMANIMLQGEKHSEFFEKFDSYCESPQVIAFIQWLQTSFEHTLPPAMSEESFYLLQKK